MPPEAVSIDFWDTLVVSREGGGGRRDARHRQLGAIASRYGPNPTPDALERATAYANQHFDRAWLGDRQTPPTTRYVQWIWESLAVEVSAEEHRETVRCFSESLIESPPGLAPFAAETLRILADRVPLAIISDTMISPGTVLRRYLEAQGVLQYFSAFVFSDETGCAKPDPRAFRTAAKQLQTSPARMAHIGDLRKTDVAGALATGATAVLYTGVRVDEEGPEPDFIASTWRDIPQILFPHHV